MATRYNNLLDWATAVLDGECEADTKPSTSGAYVEHDTHEVRFRCPLCQRRDMTHDVKFVLPHYEHGLAFACTFGPNCDHWGLFLVESFKGELTFSCYGVRTVDKIEKAMDRAREVNDAQKFEYLVDLHKQANDKGYKPTYPKARYKATYGAWPSWADDERAAKEAAK